LNSSTPADRPEYRPPAELPPEVVRFETAGFLAPPLVIGACFGAETVFGSEYGFEDAFKGFVVEAFVIGFELLLILLEELEPDDETGAILMFAYDWFESLATKSSHDGANCGIPESPPKSPIRLTSATTPPALRYFVAICIYRITLSENSFEIMVRFLQGTDKGGCEIIFRLFFPHFCVHAFLFSVESLGLIQFETLALQDLSKGKFYL
jgi:hypothetical protein